ncbi:MAG: ribonuclease Z [Oscillospiraceae bacterium]|nr:ribonuclease Z [Oscillospiraceae bacterium]
MIKVTLLGTSGLLPTPDRALTAALLEYEGRSLLFDCGEGTQTAARKASRSLAKVDLIVLTHYHGDHILGLPGLMQTLFSTGRTKPLYIMGPAGLEENMEPVLKLAGQLSYDIHLIQTGGRTRLCDIISGFPKEACLTGFPTKHRVVSTGYSFELERQGVFLPQKAQELGIPVHLWKMLQHGESVTVGDRIIEPDMVMGEKRNGLKFIFTGDTSPCKSLTDAAMNADLMICEATYAEEEHSALAAERGHMTFSQAGRCAKDANVKRLWLAHYSQRIKDPKEYLHLAADIFPSAECGYDGMTADLSFTD